MMIEMIRTKWLVAGVVLASLTLGAALAGEPPRPQASDRCPVCGMFVIKYPEWVAALEYRDDGWVFFDGPKDMFRYLHDMGTYAPGHRPEDVQTVWVTDYYTTRMIDAHQALFVAGSNVMGPMGHELVPLASEEDAETFRADHGGDPPLRFAEVTPEEIPGR